MQAYRELHSIFCHLDGMNCQIIRWDACDALRSSDEWQKIECVYRTNHNRHWLACLICNRAVMLTTRNLAAVAVGIAAWTFHSMLVNMDNDAAVGGGSDPAEIWITLQGYRNVISIMCGLLILWLIAPMFNKPSKPDIQKLVQDMPETQKPDSVPAAAYTVEEPSACTASPALQKYEAVRTMSRVDVAGNWNGNIGCTMYGYEPVLPEHVRRGACDFLRNLSS